MRYTVRDFSPLIVIFTIIIVFTVTRRWYEGDWQAMLVMSDFMAAFFFVFGFFKILNWHGFVEAYRMYDLIASRSTVYAYAYPLIELGLGIAYITRWKPTIVNGFTLVLMLLGSAGVLIALQDNRSIMCACLGAVFRLPMTYVTLFEDLLMAAMALIMLLY